MVAGSFRMSNTFSAIIVCFSVFIDTFLQSIVLLVLPYTIGRRIEHSQHVVDQTWSHILLACYGGMTVATCILFIYIGDKLARPRAQLLISMVILGVATLCYASAKSLPVLLLARILQGLSTATINTTGYALLSHLFTPEGVGKAMGFAVVAHILGLVLGQIFGGVVYEHEGDYRVFLLVFCSIGIAVILICLMTERPIDSGDGTFSPYSEATAFARRFDQGDVQTETVEIQDSHLPGLSGRSEMRTSPTADAETQPLLPKEVVIPARSILPRLLRSPRLFVASITLSVLIGTMYGLLAVLATYISQNFPVKATSASALFLVMLLPFFLGPISGIATDRCTAKWPATSGLMLIVPSLILLGLLRPGTSMLLSKLTILLFLLGVGSTLSMPPLRAEAANVVDKIERDDFGTPAPDGAYLQAYGLMSAIVAVGCLFGPLYAHFFRIWLGWGFMSVSLGILNLAMLVLVLLFSGERYEDVEKPTIEITHHGSSSA